MNDINNKLLKSLSVTTQSVILACFDSYWEETLCCFITMYTFINTSYAFSLDMYFVHFIMNKLCKKNPKNYAFIATLEEHKVGVTNFLGWVNLNFFYFRSPIPFLVLEFVLFHISLSSTSKLPMYVGIPAFLLRCSKIGIDSHPTTIKPTNTEGAKIDLPEMSRAYCKKMIVCY